VFDDYVTNPSKEEFFVDVLQESLARSLLENKEGDQESTSNLEQHEITQGKDTNQEEHKLVVTYSRNGER
jgi:hypothetical protein